MTGSTVDWMLGAALAVVAFVAGRRVVLRLAAVHSVSGTSRRADREVPDGRQFVDASVHLAMVAGMAAMLVPGGVIARPVLGSGFAVLALVLLADGVGPLVSRRFARGGAGGRAARGRHRLHHAVMAGIMVLMVLGPHASSGGAGGGTGTMPGMAMAGTVAATTGNGAPPLVLAAFGYACVSALVFAWRAPALAYPGGRADGDWSTAGRGASGSGSGTVSGCRPGAAADLLGRSCEIIMFVSTAVMLLPMI